MIVVDVETTGLDARKHAIVSIGAIDLNNPSHQFYAECQVWPGAEITDGALKVNGFTREEVTHPARKRPEDVLNDFLQWAQQCRNRTLGGMNVWFDTGFLKAACERYGVPWIFGYKYVDLYSLCFGHHVTRIPPLLKDGLADLNTNVILKYVGLPEEPKPHNGLTGAKMEAEAFSRLFYGKNLLPEYTQFSIPEYIAST